MEVDENSPTVFQELGRTMQLLCWYSLKDPASLSLITYSPTGGDVGESCLNLLGFFFKKKNLYHCKQQESSLRTCLISLSVPGVKDDTGRQCHLLDHIDIQNYITTYPYIQTHNHNKQPCLQT